MAFRLCAAIAAFACVAAYPEVIDAGERKSLRFSSSAGDAAVGASLSFFLGFSTAGLKGDCTAEYAKDMHTVTKFKMGETMPISTTPSGGRGGHGRAEFEDIVITKSLNAASPLLAQMVAEGVPVPRVTLVAIADASTELYRVEMDEVYVTGYELVSEGTTINERIKLNFAKIKWTYTKQVSGRSVTTFGDWDLSANTPKTPRRV